MSDYENLRLEFNRTAFKKMLEEKCGDRCVNCGSKEGIQYHHIVPLIYGGTNKITNIVALCYSCHKNAHGSTKVYGFSNIDKGGRPRKKFPDNYENIFWDYLKGFIGRKECYELLGMSKESKLTENSTFSDFLEENNILKYKNSVDTYSQKRFSNSNLSGKIIAVIEYKDGKIEKYFSN